MATRTVAIALLALLVVLPLACGQARPGCISGYDPNVDYFSSKFTDPFALPVQQTIDAAQDFSVTYNNSFKVLTDEKNSNTYVLYQCGAPQPDAGLFPLGTRFFEIPVSNIAIDSGVPIPYIQLLNLEKYVTVADRTFVQSPCFQLLMDSKQINALNASNDIPLQTKGVEVLFTSSYPPANSSNAVVFNPPAERGSLKRAEWIKHMALFFNAEDKATQVFNTIQQTYQCVSDLAKTMSTKPTVAWASCVGPAPDYLPCGTKTGTWTVSNAGYKVQFVADAGGSNPAAGNFTDYDMSKPSDVKAFRQALKTFDVIIDESYAVDPTTYTINDFYKAAQIKAGDNYPFLTTQNVWREDRRTAGGGVDWLEGAPAQPQEVLLELLSIVHGGSDKTPTPHFYFRNIAAGEMTVTLTKADCRTDALGGIEPATAGCTLKSSARSQASVGSAIIMTTAAAFVALMFTSL